MKARAVRIGWPGRAVVAALAAALVAGAVPRVARAPAGVAGAAAHEHVFTHEDSTRAIHLLQRATFGARPADIAEVLRVGRDAWLDRQLHPQRIDDGVLERRIGRWPLADADMGELLAGAARLRASRREAGTGTPAGRDEARRTLADTMAARRDEAVRADTTGGAAAALRSRIRKDPELRKLVRYAPQRVLAELVTTRLQRAAFSERQLEEVMTEFWFNHFNVFFGKGLDRYMVADYERTAIRPHVFGTFEEMLVATAQHPAMLFYLDNWSSAAPDSMLDDRSRERLARRRQGIERLERLTPEQRDRLVRSGRVTREQLEGLDRARAAGLDPAGRKRGINENYARELMELHTLGVDGGYTQADVIAVARALTGWTFVRPGGRRAARGGAMMDGAGGGDVTFVFRPELHDRGEKVVLGHTLPAGRGIDDGLDVLHMLATHPSTAHFISSELVAYFVTDAPAPELVDELAAVFTRTGGDLREVTRALFTSDRFLSPETMRTRVRTPFQLVASAIRLTGAEAGPSRGLISILRAMGELPYGAVPPTGYPAASADWVNSGAMLARMNFGLALAAGKMDGVRLDAAELAGGAAADAGLPVLLRTLLPGAETARLAAAIRADLAGDDAPAEPAARTARALGLVLGSPEFQKH